ncbi:UNVERIFIED_CONTAM: Pentatricopeptide repeat-containing protein [Sesamum radiatum]|uniref:Pentatricopeptide repeat-containing protein n=1 Tax=Sesamum radiatum TaxID=300843 RepID=A0AAW2UPU0_SESRA
MSNTLRTKLASLSPAYLLRNIRRFSSIEDGLGRSDYPPEPIPNRPLRRQSYPSQSPRFPKSNRVRENGNLNSFRGETDADFLERFKLGFDRKLESQTDSGDKNIQYEKAENPKPLSPPEDADEIFKKMKETGLIPNAVAMLDGLCKDGLVQEAMKLFGLMREKGTIPEVVVYTAVVEGFCKAHKFDDAIRIFKKMQSNGVVPNVFSYQVLVRGLCSGKREKGLEEAQTVIQAMRQKGYFVEEKAVREYLDKKGPFLPLVWEAILGKKASKRSLF